MKATSETRRAIIEHLEKCGGSAFVPTESAEARVALNYLITIGRIRVVWRGGRIVHELRVVPNKEEGH